MSTITDPKEIKHSEQRRRTWRDWWRSLESSIDTATRPDRNVRRGALWGLLVAVGLFAVVDALYQPSGFGFAFDFAFAAASTVVVSGLIAVGVAILLFVLRRLPLVGTGLLVGSCVVVTLGFFPRMTMTLVGLVAAMCIAASVLGAMLANVVSGQRLESSFLKNTLVFVLVFAAAGYLVGFAWLLADDGDAEKVSSWQANAALMPPMMSVSNPATPGPHAVKSLSYGAGTDIQRSEYGGAVAIRTRTVDASRFLRGVSSWTRWVRKQYWGFDVDRLPLNAHVWYPEGPGPFPLVLIAHGNHRMSDFSDGGYAYLGELLASRGFILASVDENFLNGSAGTLYQPMAPELVAERTVRAWLLLEHLQLWKKWNEDSANPFYNKVDMNRIALMGHSRGGEAAATAAAFNRMKYYPEDATVHFDYGFGLKAIVAIAPPDGQYQPAGRPRWIENVSYFTLQGGHDADEETFGGSRQADRVRFTNAGPWFTSELWVYQANHGQFNTDWGRIDFMPPRGWFLNVEPLMSSDNQRSIAKTYISAFLEATLKDRHEYLQLFKDWRAGRDWLPQTIYINRFRDASYTPLATFEEDADLVSATVQGATISGEHLALWREGPIPMRTGNRGRNGVFLGWHRSPGEPPAQYSVSLPQNAAVVFGLTSSSTLELSVAAIDQNAPLPRGMKALTRAGSEQQAPDFTIELIAADGTTVEAPMSRFADVPPPLKTKFTKLRVIESDMYENDWEPVFQTVRVPLTAFAQREFNPQKLVAVRLRFDRTANNVICISGIGFGSEKGNQSLR